MNGRTALAAAIACGAGVVVVAALVFEGKPAVQYQPAQDVKNLRCTWQYETHTVPMTALIINSTDEKRDYALRVEYLTKSDKRVGSGDLIISGVRPGQTASMTGVGDFTAGEVPTRCVIGLE